MQMSLVGKKVKGKAIHYYKDCILYSSTSIKCIERENPETQIETERRLVVGKGWGRGK